jgi:hypothetical protein
LERNGGKMDGKKKGTLVLDSFEFVQGGEF